MSWMIEKQKQQQQLSPPSPLPTVCVCMPYTGPMNFEFYRNTLAPLQTPVAFCAKQFMSFGKYSVVLARNNLVEMVKSVKPRPDYILWVDSDMVVEQVGNTKTTDPNLALANMLNFMKDDANIGAITGLYRVKKQTGFDYAIWQRLKEQNPKDGTWFTHIQKWSGNWFEVDAAGMGFMLVRTAVFDKMKKPYFHYEEVGDISEDFYFLKKMKETTPYRLWAYTDIKLRHLGSFGLNCDGSVTLTD